MKIVSWNVAGIRARIKNNQWQKFIDEKDWVFSWVLVITYQSLNRIRQQAPDLFDFIIESAWFIVSDEAHRSLWEETQITKEELLSEGVQFTELNAEEAVEEAISKKMNWKI